MQICKKLENVFVVRFDHVFVQQRRCGMLDVCQFSSFIVHECVFIHGALDSALVTKKLHGNYCYVDFFLYLLVFI